MFHRTENDYAVLSTYVADISQNNQAIRVVPNLCMVTFTSTIRNWGTKECRNLIRPKMTNAMWGAGLSFHRCHAEINVPVDPYLDGVFDGEEGSRGLRFFTHGYDVYAPDVVLVTHDYHTHQGNPVVHTWGRGHRGAAAADGGDKIGGEEVWKFRADIERERPKVQTRGTKRVNMMLGIGHPSGWNEAETREIDQIRASRYGVGTKRTLEQAGQFSGIDLAAKKMVENKCGNLKWVPYEESPDYGVGETLRRSLTDGSTLDMAGGGAADTGDAPGGLRGPGILTKDGATVDDVGAADSNVARSNADGGDGAGEQKILAARERHGGPRHGFRTLEVAGVAEKKNSAGAVVANGSTSSTSPLFLFATALAFVIICIVVKTRTSKPKNSRHKH